MPEQIYIGKFAGGMKTDKLPFAIDNDAFPTMYNFYSWRGRAKRKRGTIFLGQLQLQEQIASVPLPWQEASFNLVASGGNLIIQFSLGSSASITPKSITLVVSGDQTYTDLNEDGTLTGSSGGTGTINYATGAFTVSGSVTGTVNGTFSYFPGLPVMGLLNFVSSTSSSQFPLLLAFDTKYAYQINQNLSTVFFYNVSYYKATNNPIIWSGQDYQLFWSTNYSAAFWETNNKPGFHFVNGTYTSGSGTTDITFNFKSNTVNFTTLVIGDQLWFNEWSGGSTINGLVGTVSGVSGAASGNYVVTFANSVTVSGSGIAQLLTNSIPGQDGIRWYDGDMTNGTGLPVNKNTGWVNFAPPLTATSVSIDNTPSALYYLIGALAIVAFKDRLLFFSPTIGTSGGTSITLQDTVIWSWNGTPYYTSPVPSGETFNVSAYYVDQTGKGGYLAAGISQPIITVANNEDVLLVGFGGNIGRQTRFAYTGNDLYPFLFFNINSELGSSSTFSAVTLDRGAVTIGSHGIILTTQESSQRVDLDIPDSIFQIQNLNNGVLRVNSVRDFYKEWMYFSYPLNSSLWKFPTQTLLYNYRDNTWAVFYENFTAHGTYRKQMHYTWATLPFKTWSQWREPWNAGSTSAFFPSIIGGNPQGYVMIIGQGTGEAISGTIDTIADSSGFTQITSINHCVRINDYLLIQGALGTTSINMKIGRVRSTSDANTFVIDIPFPSGTYLGLGKYVRLSQPLLQTKQFPVYWEQGRQVRLSAQKYLMDYTANSQITVNIYLSQDPDDAWNSGTIVPTLSPNPDNSSLIYSQVMFTCPESTNIGLTPANTNLQMPTAQGQYQIWHRFNTSLIGNTFQIGITLGDTQMRNLDYATNEITLHGMHLTCDRGPHLA